MSPIESTLTDVFRAADLTGVLFNGMLGGVIARAEKLDPVGFFALAILTALGGGMLRDTLMQQGPPVALTDLAYIGTASIGAAVAYLVPISKGLWARIFPVADAIALGAWSAAGAGKALAAGFGLWPAILLGTITAVGGGALRDVALNRVPAIFGGNTLYATPAAVASAVMCALWYSPWPSWAPVITIVVGAALLLTAERMHLVLPYGRDINVLRWMRRVPVPRPVRRGKKPWTER